MDMWTPAKPKLLDAIVEELTKRGPCRFSTLWNALEDRFGSKTSFNVYLRTLVKQGIVKRQARKILTNGRWITVSRGPNVKYSLVKASPLSLDASKERIREWIDHNLKKSDLDLLTAVQYCLKGDGEWEYLFKEWELAMRLNLKMWWNMRNRSRFAEATDELLKNIERRKKQLESELEPAEQHNDTA